MTRTVVSAPAIAPWAGRIVDRSRAEGSAVRPSGSLYAVAPEHREAVASALAARGAHVHVDVIITADGAHRGLTPAELRAVREAAPDARIEVHLIFDPRSDAANAPDPAAMGDSAASDAPDQAGTAPRRIDAAVGETVAAAVESRAAVVVLPRAMHAEPGGIVAALRRAGIAVWVELPPGEPADPPEGVDGALVMLIEPGTRNAADPSLVSRVAELSTRLPVGVDGGVTSDLAERCIAAGATTIVAGRALFVPAEQGEGES